MAGTVRVVTTALSLGVSGILQQIVKQFPNSQQVAAGELGCIGFVSQPSFAMDDPATAATGAETSTITADINTINKAFLIFIAV